MTTFKERIHLDLKDYLTGLDLVDKRLPECPDLDACRNQLLEAYLPDGVREFNAYPTVSLGWMMFLGMAWPSLGQGLEPLRCRAPTLRTSARCAWLRLHGRIHT